MRGIEFGSQVQNDLFLTIAFYATIEKAREGRFGSLLSYPGLNTSDAGTGIRDACGCEYHGPTLYLAPCG